MAARVRTLRAPGRLRVNTWAFWVFDGQVVRWNHFSGDSSWVGEERSDDPALARLCASSFDAAWERGVPHGDYQPA
jgi:hypothetical protein